MSGLGTDVIVERTDPLTGEEFFDWACLQSADVPAVVDEAPLSRFTDR